MWKSLLLAAVASCAAFADPADEWEPFRKTGLFSQPGALWVAVDMEKESVPEFSARLLDGARQGEPKAMATLGRFFFARGAIERAVEWLGKAAEAGHGGAQFDVGTLCRTGQGVPKDLIEAYKWFWLATWADVPGADAALLDLSNQISRAQLVRGVRRAAAFQDARKVPAPAGK